MNEFVDACRREWQRLAVPDPAAEEMAAELAADLAEAEAEGFSAEDVLGSGALDARSFAAAWAAEKGVVPSRGRARLRRLGMPVAIAAFGLVAIVGAVLVIVASPGTGRLALEPPAGPTEALALQRTADGGVRVVMSPVETPVGPSVWVARPDVRVALRLPPTGAQVAVDVDDPDDGTRVVGAVLLGVGLVGVVSLALLSSSAGSHSRLRS